MMCREGWREVIETFVESIRSTILCRSHGGFAIGFIEAELARLELPDVIRRQRSDVNTGLNQLFDATLAQQR